MPKPIFVIANPAPPGDLPSGALQCCLGLRSNTQLTYELALTLAGLEIDVHHPTNELGPIALHVSSPHLTVASLLFLSVTFEKPPEGLKIMSVQAFVRQEFEIHCAGDFASFQEDRD